MNCQSEQVPGRTCVLGTQACRCKAIWRRRESVFAATGIRSVTRPHTDPSRAHTHIAWYAIWRRRESVFAATGIRSVTRPHTDPSRARRPLEARIFSVTMPSAANGFAVSRVAPIQGVCACNPGYPRRCTGRDTCVCSVCGRDPALQKPRLETSGRGLDYLRIALNP